MLSTHAHRRCHRPCTRSPTMQGRRPRLEFSSALCFGVTCSGSVRISNPLCCDRRRHTVPWADHQPGVYRPTQLGGVVLCSHGQLQRCPRYRGVVAQNVPDVEHGESITARACTAYLRYFARPVRRRTRVEPYQEPNRGSRRPMYSRLRPDMCKYASALLVLSARNALQTNQDGCVHAR